ncbi:hypothetical protein EGI15_01600 [Chryseobacterium cucumeris]|uniref:Uncharacterized protein n=1 Tax=Chryseobacterium cucumeris TaxID=1813611 RepID=A0ABX9XDR4_9FLAO|nr:hypothetical protein [Chryseobacterium cucumeris]ROH96516.1 hypothetical protein EGI15_01600 [Chryseobacterium cucumeris]
MDTKIRTLIQMLKDKTANKEAIWSRTSGDNEFKIEINKATITTDFWYHNDVGYYDIIILNENGDTIERVVVNNDNLDENYWILHEFYEIVKNNYLKVDETIDNILIELNTSNKIGGKNK